MPEKKRKDKPGEQRKRFEKAVEKMMADGELNPTEAEAALDKLLSGGLDGSRDRDRR